MNSRGPLRAGGNRVHPILRKAGAAAEEEDDFRPDRVPVIERYQDLAQHIHRTAVSPRGDRYLVGCVCGWFTLTNSQISSAKASMVAQEHVIAKAEEMFQKLEPKPIGEDE